MRKIRKFLHLNSAERRLLFEASIVLVAYRVALWLFPWSRVRELRPLSEKSRAGRFTVERLEWAVRAASRPIPRATCLTQALALHRLLARAGYSSSIQIGVGKTPARGFEAHAWVEHGGMTLLSSASEVAHYSRLSTRRALPS
jgi:Transglutaminase-like superfamily